MIYRGFVHLPEADLPLWVQIDLPSGATRASLSEGSSSAEPRPTLEPSADLALAKEAAALVRSATRTAVAAHTALPRKIVRWRG